MSEWRINALKSLDDARAEIEGADVATVVVILTIAEADLLKEMPISIYANQNWRWLQKVLAFAAWRTALKEDEASPTPSSEVRHGCL